MGGASANGEITRREKVVGVLLYRCVKAVNASLWRAQANNAVPFFFFDRQFITSSRGGLVPIRGANRDARVSSL